MASSPERMVPAIVISDLGGGGTQRVVLRLASDWLKQGYPVKLITLSHPESDAYPVPAKVQRVALGMARPSAGLASALAANIARLRELRRALRDCGATLAVSFLASTNVLTLLASAGLGIRVVVSERNDPAVQNIGWHWALLRRLLYRRADTVTANSRGAIKALEAYVPREKLILVPNPMPGWTIAARSRRPREKLVLSVGRLHPQKGHDRLLRAFASSGVARRGWSLAILGEGGERGSLEALAGELGIADAVRLPGHVTNVADWYRRSSLFVLLSNYEGTPNAVIEAIAMGLPVVISENCGDAAWLARQLDCGVVVGTDDEDGAAQALSRLATDGRLRQKLGRNGARGLAAHHSEEAVSRAWLQAIQPAGA